LEPASEGNGGLRRREGGEEEYFRKSPILASAERAVEKKGEEKEKDVSLRTSLISGRAGLCRSFWLSKKQRKLERRQGTDSVLHGGKSFERRGK